MDEEANDDEELGEADESIMMSQRVWDDIEPQLLETGDEQMTDVQENDIASQRYIFKRGFQVPFLSSD